MGNELKVIVEKVNEARSLIAFYNISVKKLKNEPLIPRSEVLEILDQIKIVLER